VSLLNFLTSPFHYVEKKRLMKMKRVARGKISTKRGEEEE